MDRGKFLLCVSQKAGLKTRLPLYPQMVKSLIFTCLQVILGCPCTGSDQACALHNQVLQAKLVEGWQIRKPVIKCMREPSAGRDHQDLRWLPPACHTNSSAAEQGFEDLSGTMVDGPCLLEGAGRPLLTLCKHNA